MRIITADEMGLVKVSRLESGECLAVSGGEQTRLRAVRALCHQNHIASTPRNSASICGGIHVARLSGAIETWDLNQTELIEDKSTRCELKHLGTIENCPPEPVALASLPLDSPSERGRILSCNGAGEVHICPMSSDSPNGSSKAIRFSIRGPLSAAIVVGTRATSGPPSLAAGGRENDLKLWDLNTTQCTWKAKNVPNDFLDLRQPVWISSLRSLELEGGSSSDSGGTTAHQIIAGTAYRQVRLYDTRAQKRPTHSVDADEHGITTMAVAPNAREVVVADTAGLVRVLDLRKMKWGRRFNGPAGSVRGLAFHPSLPVLACVGLDRMARVYDYHSREQNFQLYLKQRLNAVLFDGEGEVAVAANAADSRDKYAADQDGSGSDGWGSQEEYDMDEDDSSEENQRRTRMGTAMNGDGFNHGKDGNGNDSSDYSSEEGERASGEGSFDDSGESTSESEDAHIPPPKQQQARKGGQLAKKRRR